MKYKIMYGDCCNELHKFDTETQQYIKVSDTDFDPDEIDDAVNRYENELQYQEKSLMESYDDYGDENERSTIY